MYYNIGRNAEEEEVRKKEEVMKKMKKLENEKVT